MTRRNNFDFLRIMFASFVIIQHSSSLSNISSSIPIISNLANFGVYGFFIISGYLVTGSLTRSGYQRIFLAKRFLRIFPGLTLMATVVMVSIGFISPLDKSLYFINEQTLLHYISTVTLVPTIKCLPGMFQNNPAGCAVNGSLWTLRYEILFYLLLSSLYFIKSRKRKWVILTIFIASTCALLSWNIFDLNFSSQIDYHLERFLNLVTYFTYGSVLFLYPGLKNKTSYYIALIVFVTFLTINSIKLSNLIQPLTYPIIVIYIGSSFTKWLQFSNRIGDVSYGMYIYAYPIQQIIIQIYSPKNLLGFTFVSLLISLFLGLISWHLIEKHFLYKKSNYKLEKNIEFMQQRELL